MITLHNYNYRVWIAGSTVSNLGTWMQRIAQDWLVLTQLTNNSATALGIVMVLQFGPILLLFPLAGAASDYIDRRKLLIVTEAGLGLVSIVLGLLTVFELVQLWHVYLLALLFGCITAFDQPARQTFVGELVDDANLPNAIALNATSFNAARLIGPAIAGVLIAAVGTGWAFLINGASFVGVLISLCFLREKELRKAKFQHQQGILREGLLYVFRRRDLKAAFVMLFVISTFGFNFPIFISTMAISVFHKGASEFGLLTSMMAIGSVLGAVLATRRPNPDLGHLLGSAAIFGVGCALAALTPTYWFFGGALALMGVSALTFGTAMSSFVQLATEPNMRGRVMAFRGAVSSGTAPLGAPIVGWVADAFGPRWALLVGAAAAFVAVATYYVAKFWGLGIDQRTP